MEVVQKESLLQLLANLSLENEEEVLRKAARLRILGEYDGMFEILTPAFLTDCSC